MMRVLSNTQIGMWLRCPQQWKYRYIDGLKIPPAGVMVQGSAYHGALKDNFQHRIKTQQDLSVSELVDSFDTHWNNYFKGRNVDHDEDELDASEINWEGEDPGKLKDEGIVLARIYHSLIAPNVEPLKVESYYEKNIENIKFIGYLDVETPIEIIDHKLKSKSMSQIDADRDIQPLSYCLFTRKNDFTYHVAVKKKQPEIQVVRVKKTEQDIFWWINVIKQVAAQMETGLAPPNPTNWTCSPKFCGYWNLCRERS